MKARKLLSEIAGQGSLRKQRSEIINSKYLTSHESTSFCGQFGTSTDQLSSISLRDCFQELNAHLSENRPLRPGFVIQIKKFLSQCKRSESRTQENQENKRKSKDSFCEERFIIRSPYIVNRSLKKFKPAIADNQTTDIVRKTLRKKKINYENGEAQIVNRAKMESQKSERKLTKKTFQVKQLCEKVNQELKFLRSQFLSQIQSFKAYLSSQIQTVHQIASTTFRFGLMALKKQFSKRQSNLSETIQELEDKLKQAAQRQRILRDYLSQRETELVTCWSAFNQSRT